MTDQSQPAVIPSGIVRKHKWGDPDYSVGGVVRKKCQHCKTVKVTRVRDGWRSYRNGAGGLCVAKPPCEGEP